MGLEPELIKDILLWCEEKLPDDEKSWLASNLEFEGFDRKQIVFHIKLLYENGYIDCDVSSELNSKDYFLSNLTMNGYQYLELLKSKAWSTAKSIMHDMGVIFAEAAIKAIIAKSVV